MLISTNIRLFRDRFLYTLQAQRAGKRHRQRGPTRVGPILYEMQAAQAGERIYAVYQGEPIVHLFAGQIRLISGTLRDKPDITFFGEPIDVAVQEQLER